ncbi:MAG: hypothetical protein ACJ741_20680 [Pyrinomonadaceae bacterium]
MTLVYATGQPRSLEFATAASRRLVPGGATVLAVVDDERAVAMLDEQTFERMTDTEYYELQGLINSAQRDD